PIYTYSFCASLLLLNDSAFSDIYTLSLHDALPIFGQLQLQQAWIKAGRLQRCLHGFGQVALAELVGGQVHRHLNAAQALVLPGLDRKSTRLNSSHVKISYAVFCLKNKN